LQPESKSFQRGKRAQPLFLREEGATGSFREGSRTFPTGFKMNLSFWIEDKEFKLSLEERSKNEILVSLGKRKHHVSVEFITPDEVLLNIDGKIHEVIINSNSFSFSIYVNGRFFKIEKKSVSQILGREAVRPRKRDIVTSMPGRIIKVFVREGEKVREGQAVLVLEAMKMQNEIKSPQSGTITKIVPKAGDSVEAGSILFSVE
jgi:biotin carboxyl carrier protein